MTTPTPISCAIHDHLELACMRSYLLEIHLLDGAQVVGRAHTTRSREKVEYLVVIDDNQTWDVAMHEVERIRVLTPDASFAELIVKSHCG